MGKYLIVESKLAIDGGSPVRTNPWPTRALIGEEEKAAAVKVFDEAISSGNAFGYNGPNEQQYEKDFADFMGGGFADGVNSGTNALYCALGGLRIDVLSEIIVPPITDAGGVMPVPMLNCVPVFADAAPRSFNTSAEQIEPVITPRTKAIVVAHIGGEPVDMDPVMRLAEKFGLYVVEDCAQSHGALYKGRKVGTIGDAGVFSTMNGKLHCTGGQGGVVYTRNEELYWQMRRFADRGKNFNVDISQNVMAGINCNLNELSAAIGCVQIKKLPVIVEKRMKLGESIKRGFTQCKAVSMGWHTPESQCVYWFVRCRINSEMIKVSKQKFCEALTREGLDIVESYRHIQCFAPWFKDKKVFGNSGFPWDCSDYKGDKNPDFKMTNVIEAVNEHFILLINESYEQQEVDDITAAIKKVENAYLK
ncbi:MAG: DegT/DnrJ/EryC1/StrS family aminotransferase [Bacteroidales bacterium]|nr:DegT/DnrJ/EryC1/StrS family aminotransferase [Bacteroidales bacterium]